MTLRLYAIVCKDLNMSKGKMAAQAGHAFLGAGLECNKSDPARMKTYLADFPGTKIVLEASLTEILDLWSKAQKKEFSCSLTIDSGHIMLPYFNGQEIVTALGIGPLNKRESDFLKHLPLVK
jgi:peptidyl-tRNA hydrolase